MANGDGLQRMYRLLELLGNPEKNLRIFHIAGTNGKGSTAAFIASVLEQAGYSVGLFTSPHLQDIHERIQVWDGRAKSKLHHLIPDADFEELRAKVLAAGEELAEEKNTETGQNFGPLHFFEILAATAYLYFDRVQPDYVVLECGLGGRLDTTNTIEKPLVSVITEIGLDHTATLGGTIFKIAEEKAGIIKAGCPVVSQMSYLAVNNIISRHAREKGSEFIDASREIGKYRKYKLGLKGDYQYNNATTAVEAIKAAGIELSDEIIEKGLANVVHPGRFEIIEGQPKWVLDGAHNPDAVDALTSAYSAWARTNKIKRTVVIFGAMKDKNYRKMIQILCSKLKGCTYMTVAVENDRAENAELLGDVFSGLGRSCLCCESVAEAYEEALKANPEAVLVLGSIYLAGDIRSYCNK